MYSKIKLGRQSWVKIWFKKIKKFEFIGEMSEMSNVEKYNLFRRKHELLGNKMYFEFKVIKEKDAVLITKYIKNDDEFRKIEIPSFVTNIDTENYIRNFIFEGVRQSLKVINKSKMKDMSSLFRFYRGDELDLSEFNTIGSTNMKNMFADCSNLKEIDVSNFDTSCVMNMSGMFSNCVKLNKIDLSNFCTINVMDTSSMFHNCISLKDLDISSLDMANVVDSYNMYNNCLNLINVK